MDTLMPQGAERRLLHHDGSVRMVRCLEEEVPYPDGHLIVSRTDLRGDLTHFNEAFVTMSGYTEDELRGAPHCILRHPDMPRRPFAELWSTLQARQKWHGYVKNLCKDGRYYWVYATAVPNVRHGEVVGYTSVRRKPSRQKIEEISAQYRDWLALEQKGGA